MNVDQRLSDADTLWRYMDLAKFVDLLQSKRVFAARGDMFEDRFEGQFSPQVRAHITAYYEAMPHLQYSADQFKLNLRKRVFINCWHRAAHESMAMWSIYGRSSGVAIVTTVGNLKREIELALVSGIRMLELVEYVDYSEADDLKISPYSRLFAYKHRAYSHEAEVRLIVDRYLEDPEGETPEHGIYLGVMPSRFVQRVVVAPESPVWFSEVVSGLMQSYCPTVSSEASALSRPAL